MAELPDKVFCRPAKKGEEWWSKYDGTPKIGTVGCFYGESYNPCNLFVVVDNFNYPYLLSVIFPRMRLNKSNKNIEFGQDCLTEEFNYNVNVKCNCIVRPSNDKICQCGVIEKKELDYNNTFQLLKNKHTLYTVKHIIPERVWDLIDPELPRVGKNIWIDFPTTIEYIPSMPLIKSYIGKI